jgi:hypothetical protein
LSILADPMIRRWWEKITGELSVPFLAILAAAGAAGFWPAWLAQPISGSGQQARGALPPTIGSHLTADRREPIVHM